MNRMLGRLERAHDQQRRFVSDASHELRSPVASIRQHAEVALAHPDGTSTTELAATVLAEDLRMAASAGTDIGSGLTGYHLQAYVQRFSSLLP